MTDQTENTVKTTLSAYTKGCKNCSKTICYLVKEYAEISSINFDSFTNQLELLSSDLVRALRLTSAAASSPPVGVESSTAADDCEDCWFIGDSSASIVAASPPHSPVATKRAKLASASCLVPVMSLEIECRAGHLVPGWAVELPRSAGLQQAYSFLNKTRPLPPTLGHVKRIDSCREWRRADCVPVLLGLSQPSFRYKDAVKLVVAMTAECYGHESPPIAFALYPAWVPFCPPLTRPQQTRYAQQAPTPDDQPASLNAESGGTNADLGRTIVGWPTTLRAHPMLQRLLSTTPFGDSELERHNAWLDAVVSLSIGAESTCQDGNAILLVDPATNTLVAQAAHDSPLAPTNHLDRHAVMRAVALVGALQQAAPSSSAAAYLCTGLDAYAGAEPCFMCGMALLHSRIGRVFCARRSSSEGERGAFTSVPRLHVEEKLNHRFSVFVRDDGSFA